MYDVRSIAIGNENKCTFDVQKVIILQFCVFRHEATDANKYVSLVNMKTTTCANYYIMISCILL